MQSSTQTRCHWCNRPVQPDELVVLIVPSRSEVDANGQPVAIEEQPWHNVCFGMIQGVPGGPGDDD